MDNGWIFRCAKIMCILDKMFKIDVKNTLFVAFLFAVS